MTSERGISTELRRIINSGVVVIRTVPFNPRYNRDKTRLYAAIILIKITARLFFSAFASLIGH